MKITKIIRVLKRKIIFLFDGLNDNLYMKMYNKWLKKSGLDIQGDALYICKTTLIDGLSYKQIHIGNNVVISTRCILMAHDFSLRAGLDGLKMSNGKKFYTIKDIYIGENTFVGAGCIILGGAKIGKNCIIGAGSVLPGKNYPDDSIIVGNPGKVIGKTSEWAIKKYNEGDFIVN